MKMEEIQTTASLSRNMKEKYISIFFSSFNGLAKFKLVKSPGTALRIHEHSVITHPFRRIGANSDLVQASIVLLKLENSCSTVPRINPGSCPHKSQKRGASDYILNPKTLHATQVF